LRCGAAGFALSLFIVAVLLSLPSAADFQTDCAGFDREPLIKTKVVLSDGKKRAEVSAEVASADDEKMRGLMCRKNLPDGTGMLFVYETPQTGGFWMFNTYLDLDILYLAEDGTVVEKVRMRKCPRSSGENLREWKTRCHERARAYRPSGQYTAALEIPAGWPERKSFEPEKIRAEWKLATRKK